MEVYSILMSIIIILTIILFILGWAWEGKRKELVIAVCVGLVTGVAVAVSINWVILPEWERSLEKSEYEEFNQNVYYTSSQTHLMSDTGKNYENFSLTIFNDFEKFRIYNPSVRLVFPVYCHIYSVNLSQNAINFNYSLVSDDGVNNNSVFIKGDYIISHNESSKGVSLWLHVSWDIGANKKKTVPPDEIVIVGEKQDRLYLIRPK